MSWVQNSEPWWAETRWRQFEHLAPQEALEEIKTAGRCSSACDTGLLTRAVDLVGQRHALCTWTATGRPKIQHVLAVAWTVAELHQDRDGIAAALLHDLIKEGRMSAREMEERFGTRVTRLVQYASSLEEPATSGTLWQSLSSAGQRGTLPATIIMLAEELDYLRFCAPQLPPDLREELARRAMCCDAPWAERLGMWELKAQIEDLGFQYLAPQEYNRVQHHLAQTAGEYHSVLDEAMRILRAELPRLGIDSTLVARTKHVYGAYAKSQRKGISFDKIHDLGGMRIIVERLEDCYRALAVVRSLWKPVPGEFDDYIQNPKMNGYRSLHTALFSPNGFTFEVQIRTRAMHREAESGPAAHWRYCLTRSDSLLVAGRP